MVLGTTASAALAGNTSLLQLGLTSSTALAGNTTTITSQQATDITTNNAKVGITTTQANEIAANTLKTGITTQQATDITNNNAKISFTSTGTDNYLSKWSSNTLIDSLIYDNGTNVGIGTTSPSQKLQVNGNARIDGDALVEDNLYLMDAGTTRAKIQLNAGDRDNLDIKALSLGSTMNFFTQDTLALSIDASQNVGIGTTTPSDKLSVVSTVGILGDNTDQGLLKLYCEASTHYVGIKGGVHAGGVDYTLQLPNALPNVANQILESNASGTLSWIATPINTIDSVVSGEPTGSDQVINVVSLTQAEYDAGTPVATTFYIIT